MSETKLILDATVDDDVVHFTIRCESDGEIRTGKLSAGEPWALIRTSKATYDGRPRPE